MMIKIPHNAKIFEENIDKCRVGGNSMPNAECCMLENRKRVGSTCKYTGIEAHHEAIFFLFISDRLLIALYKFKTVDLIFIIF